MKIIEAIEQIKRECHSRPFDTTKSVDQIIAGDAKKELTGIVTSFMATVDVINKAAEIGANLIITHEPTWFNGRDLEPWLKEDHVYLNKKKLIESKGIVIWRFHDYMHFSPKDQIYKGFELELGWESFSLEGNKESDNPLEQADICYQVPKTNLEELLKLLKSRLNMEVIRYQGSANAEIERVGLLLGGSSLGLGDETNPVKLIRDQALDAVICGEIVEWTTAAYVRDANMLGLDISMIVIGHEKSEESGMKYLVPWLEEFITHVPIAFIESGEPFEFNY